MICLCDVLESYGGSRYYPDLPMILEGRMSLFSSVTVLRVGAQPAVHVGPWHLEPVSVSALATFLSPVEGPAIIAAFP